MKIGLLPIVHPLTSCNVVGRVGDRDYFLKLTESVFAENPEIMSVLSNLVTCLKENAGIEAAQSALSGGLLVYQLLRSQAEADQLRSEQ